MRIKYLWYLKREIAEYFISSLDQINIFPKSHKYTGRTESIHWTEG